MQRRGLEICVDIMEVLPKKGLIISVIDRKTRVNMNMLHKYLDFLESIGYVSSIVNVEKMPGNGESKTYYLEKAGKEFLKSWHDFSKKYDIENLQKQL